MSRLADDQFDMTTQTQQSTPGPIDNLLASPPEIGEPISSGPLTVYPIFGPEPRFEYVGLGQAGEQVTIGELPKGADVNALQIQNDCALPVLLYPGEALLGAQQDRMVDVPVVVPAKVKMRIPVSCVEAGRWDHSRHGHSFVPAPQFAPRSVRQMKTAARETPDDAVEVAREQQQEVWSEVGGVLNRAEAESATSSVHDAFAARSSELDEIEDELSPQPGQAGALVAIGSDIVALEMVSRPLSFESLWSRLARSYALDAVDLESAVPPGADVAKEFLDEVLAGEPGRSESLGAGVQLRVNGDALAPQSRTGVGLEIDGELIQLSVFA
jgi:hypothetical protein